jgi:hypothetical protein
MPAHEQSIRPAWVEAASAVQVAAEGPRCNRQERSALMRSDLRPKWAKALGDVLPDDVQRTAATARADHAAVICERNVIISERDAVIARRVAAAA